MKIILPDIPGGAPFWDEDVNQHRVLAHTLKPGQEWAEALIKQAVSTHQHRFLSDANSSGQSREKSEQEAKGIMGALAEEWFLKLLRHTEQRIQRPQGASITFEALEPKVTQGEFDQVDVLITKTFLREGKQETRKTTLELRSSFPFLALKETIFHNFDILGPYTNERKITEQAKHLYARVLIDLDPPSWKHLYAYRAGNKIDYSATATRIINEAVLDASHALKAPVKLIFVGGATQAMMEDDAVSYMGTMQSNTFSGSGRFRKIKIYNALDAPSFLRLVLGHVGDAHVKGR